MKFNKILISNHTERIKLICDNGFTPYVREELLFVRFELHLMSVAKHLLQIPLQPFRIAYQFKCSSNKYKIHQIDG